MKGFIKLTIMHNGKLAYLAVDTIASIQDASYMTREIGIVGAEEKKKIQTCISMKNDIDGEEYIVAEPIDEIVKMIEAAHNGGGNGQA